VLRLVHRGTEDLSGVDAANQIGRRVYLVFVTAMDSSRARPD